MSDPIGPLTHEEIAAHRAGHERRLAEQRER
jgi:hypothetical protein